MTFDNYLDACKRFREDSRDWSALETGKHYTTTGEGWVESCDDADGGIDVSWAFWQNGWNVDEEARSRYDAAYRDMLRLADDDEWDAEQRRFISELFEDKEDAK